MTDVISFLDVLKVLVDGFNMIYERVLLPVGVWVPEAISNLPGGSTVSPIVDFFFNKTGLGELSLVAILFGSGILIFMAYTFITWILNIIT